MPQQSVPTFAPSFALNLLLTGFRDYIAEVAALDHNATLGQASAEYLDAVQAAARGLRLELRDSLGGRRDH